MSLSARAGVRACVYRYRAPPRRSKQKISVPAAGGEGGRQGINTPPAVPCCHGYVVGDEYLEAE